MRNSNAADVIQWGSSDGYVPPIELMLASGDRLRIPHDAATLKLVLAVLREQA